DLVMIVAGSARTAALLILGFVFLRRILLQLFDGLARLQVLALEACEFRSIAWRTEEAAAAGRTEAGDATAGAAAARGKGLRHVLHLLELLLLIFLEN